METRRGRRQTRSASAHRGRSNSSSSASSVHSSTSTDSGEEASVSSLVHTPVRKDKGGRPWGSGSDGRSNKRTIPEFEQKVIASDVEEFGGLDVVKSKGGFGRLVDCFSYKDDERARIYGEAGSKQRHKVRHRIDYWSRIGHNDYNKLLQSWSIVPAAYREGQKQPAKRATPSRELVPAANREGKKQPVTPSRELPTKVSTYSTQSVDDLTASFSSIRVNKSLNRVFENMPDHKVCKYQFSVCLTRFLF